MNGYNEYWNSGFNKIWIHAANIATYFVLFSSKKEKIPSLLSAKYSKESF